MQEKASAAKAAGKIRWLPGKTAPKAAPKASPTAAPKAAPTAAPKAAPTAEVTEATEVTHGLTRRLDDVNALRRDPEQNSAYLENPGVWAGEHIVKDKTLVRLTQTRGYGSSPALPFVEVD